MQRADYDAWAVHHATVCALRGESDLDTLAAWYDLLAAEARYASELHAATREMVSGGIPAWLREHLGALLAIIRRRRAEQVQADREAVCKDERGSCVQCGGSGRVTVPQLRAIAGGEWVPLSLTRSGTAVYYTTCVCCSCALGQWYAGMSIKRNGETQCPMTLREYEFHNPEWRAQAEHRRLIDREEQRHTAEMADEDARMAMDRTIDRLCRKYGIPGAGVA